MPIPRGTLLGPYEIQQLLGTGGMGEVYRARDTKLGRAVAVKVLSAQEAQNAGALVRFEQEARAASALNHPAILTIYDIGNDDGRPFLAMELVDGESLDRKLVAGGLGPRAALSIAAQAAAGLAAAHQAGIVHRDLKPENVMVTRDGRVKIVDFGLAKLLGSSSEAAQRLTRTGFVVGTAAYMSPEQARGQSVDYRSDQFALGSLLYEMLTGEAAFTGPSIAQTMTAVIEEQPPALGYLEQQVPGRAYAALCRCLEKDPARRFGETQELAEELRLAAEEAQKTRATTLVRVERPRWAHPALLAGACVACLAAGLVAGALLAPRQAVPAPVLEPITHSGSDTSPAASPDGARLAFVSTRDGSSRIWLKDLTSGAEAPLTAGPDDSPRFSPDGGSVAFVRHAARGDLLCRVPVVGGEPRVLLDDVAAADWVPDGRSLVFVRWRNEQGSQSSEVGLVGADGSESRVVGRVPGVPLVHPRVSPDGRTVALTSNGLQTATGLLAALDLGSGRVSPLVPSEEGPHHSSVTWLAKGRFLVSRSLSRTAFVVNMNRPAQLLLGRPGDPLSETVLWTPAFGFVQDVLPDGRLVLEARSVRGNLLEASLREPERRRLLTRGTLTDRQPVFSPDGTRLLFTSNRTGGWDVWQLDRGDGALRNLMGNQVDDWDPAFTSRGERILWSSNRSGEFAVFVSAADGSGVRRLTPPGLDAQNPSAAPDGAVVVFACAERAREGVWRIQGDGSEARRLVAGRAQLPEVSPDGTLVAYVTGDRGRTLVRVVALSDGAAVPFEIDVGPERATNRGVGRLRWMPDGAAIAFVSPLPDERRAVAVQEFRPGADTTATRRLLLAPDPGTEVETFAISPDGGTVVAELVETVSNLLLATGVPGVVPPQRHPPR